MKVSYYAIVQLPFIPGTKQKPPLMLTHTLRMDSKNPMLEFQDWIRTQTFPHGTKVLLAPVTSFQQFEIDTILTQ